MAKPSKKTPEEKMRVVLAVLRGEASAAEAGRKAGVSEQTASNWKRAFLESGRAGLDAGRPSRNTRRRGRSGAIARCGPWPALMVTMSAPRRRWLERCVASGSSNQ